SSSHPCRASTTRSPCCRRRCSRSATRCRRRTSSRACAPSCCRRRFATTCCATRSCSMRFTWRSAACCSRSPCSRRAGAARCCRWANEDRYTGSALAGAAEIRAIAGRAAACARSWLRPALEQLRVARGEPGDLERRSVPLLDGMQRARHFEQQRPLFRIADEALHPEYDAEPHAACHRRDMMNARRRIEEKVARRQLDRWSAGQRLDDELAPVVLGGIGQEKGCGQIGAQRIAAAHQRIVDVRTVFHSRRVPVHQRSADTGWERGGFEERVTLERLHHCLLNRAAITRGFVDLLVALASYRFAARSDAAVDPRRPRGRLSKRREILGGQELRQVQ